MQFFAIVSMSEFSHLSIMSEKEKVSFTKVYFEGHVQGVGFRYSCLQIAKGYEVTGYVRNLVDGRVELEVEGSQKELGAFIQKIRHDMDGFIRKVETKEGRRERIFKSFEIR